MAKRVRTIQTVNPDSTVTESVTKTTAGQTFKWIMLGFGFLICAGIGNTKNAGMVAVIVAVIAIAFLLQHLNRRNG